MAGSHSSARCVGAREVHLTTALYGTIWIALALFVIGEAGNGPLAGRDRPAAWSWMVSILGAVLAALHVLIALGIRYKWDHDAAVIGTARQAAVLYGFEWRGSIYVSYLFILGWFAASAYARGRSPAKRLKPSRLTWAWRIFSFIVIANGAIVFARPPWRALGVAIVGVLLWSWLPSASLRLRRRSCDVS